MLNSVIIRGRIGKDLEVNKTSNNRSYIRLRIACDRDGTGYNDRERITDWLDATAWGRTAEFIARNFKKGDNILIEGSLHSNQWKDRNGNNRYSIEINVNNVDFCGKRSTHKEGTEMGELPEAGNDNPFVNSDDDGELPWNEETDLPL